MYLAGKFLQALALVIVPLALWYGISHQDEPGVLMKELLVLAAGAALFLVGRRMEGGRPGP